MTPRDTNKVVNIVDEVADGRIKRLDPSRVNKLIIHRVGVNLKAKPPVNWGNSARDIAPHFLGSAKPDAGKNLGHEIPYTFFVTPDGVVEQTLHLYDYGPHASRYNSTGIGIAVIGDFRVVPPTEEQYKSLVWLCAVVCDSTDIKSGDIYGHTDLPNASRDPTKVCPGDKLSISKLRHDVRLRKSAFRRMRLWDHDISLL